MVSAFSAGRARIGFRRDIQLFLAVLIGYFIVFILLLLMLLQSSLIDLRESVLAHRDSVAGMATERALPGVTAETLLLGLREERDVMGVMIEFGGSTFTAGATADESAMAIRRIAPGGSLTVYFDNSALTQREKTFTAVAAVCIGGTVLGTIMLLLYLKKILGPIEKMLEHAEELEVRSGEVDEAQYLIETFRKSVELLKSQKSEIEQLHAIEKSRADDLERVTATLTRSITAGFIATDRDARIVRANNAAREILAIGEGASIEGQSIQDAFGSSELATALEAALEHRETFMRQETTVRRGETEAAIGLTTVPLLDDQREYLGMIVIIADLTDVRSLENRVRELQSLADLGELSAGIAHEFRNSLATILGYLRLLGKGELTEEATARLRSAEAEADQLKRAVESLLRVAGPIEPHVDQVDLRQIVEPIVARLESENSSIEFSITGEWPTIQGDGALLNRMFENLLLNAVDAVTERPAGGSHVEARASAGEPVRIEIIDDGVGLDPSEANRLFLPFQSGKAKGFGLGLPLARKIALLHGGRIELDGIPGKGARIVVTLPHGA